MYYSNNTGQTPNPTTPTSLSKDKVLEVATKLIEKDSVTSTLDVKNELRKLGYPEYLAHQKNISELMDELYNDSELDFTFNGTFRVYELIADSTVVPNHNILTTISGHVKTKVDVSSIEIINEEDALDEDWLIYNVDNKDAMIISEQYGRDVARRFGKLTWDMDYVRVRACRVKNS